MPCKKLKIWISVENVEFSRETDLGVVCAELEELNL